MKNMTLILALLGLLWTSGVVLGASTGAPDSTAVTGVIGVTPVGEATYLSVLIPVPEGKALSGLRWYNNDGSMVFPHLLLATESSGIPGGVSEATAVADSIQGASSAWSEVTLNEPVASATSGLIAILQLPAGSEQQYLGTGGGAGIGYSAGTGLSAWVSEDGVEWVGLDRQLRLAVVPVFTTAAPGMTVLSKQMGTPTPAVPLKTALLPARPNPFNPKTTISFSLRRPGNVEIGIFNVRGALVRKLLNETCSAGTRTLEWSGIDDHGRIVPSGVYVVRMRAEGTVQSQRLLLVK